MKALPLTPPRNKRLSGWTQAPRMAPVRRIIEGPYLLLVAVGLVVVLVSLPLLRGLALRENERDALRTMHLFGNQVFAAEPGARASLGALVEGDSSLQRHLPDTRLLNDGRRILRHGYLFDLVQSSDGTPLLRGWPYAHGKSGLAAFVMGADGELYANPNSPGLFSGQASPPVLEHSEARPDSASWRALPGGATAR